MPRADKATPRGKTSKQCAFARRHGNTRAIALIGPPPPHRQPVIVSTLGRVCLCDCT